MYIYLTTSIQNNTIRNFKTQKSILKQLKIKTRGLLKILKVLINNKKNICVFKMLQLPRLANFINSNLMATVAHRCHDKTKTPRQDQKATAKPKRHGKTKEPRQNKKAMAKQKSHGKTKNSGQNEKATAKQNSHGKIKKSQQNKKVMAKLKATAK